MKNRVAVCVISNRFFDEDYIEEWCEHYYNLGFDFIYVLEDLNGRKEKFIDMKYMKDKVEKEKMMIEEICHQNQYDTYPKFYEKHKNEFDWCGLFDSDEFLVLNKHKNIKDFLNQKVFNNADVITINWRLFGDNGQIHKKEGKVVNRFQLPAQYKNIIETKIIIRGNLEKTDFFIGHCCIANGNALRTMFCDGTLYTKSTPFHETNYDIAMLNHYCTKSTEEFIKRKSYGRLDIPDRDKYQVLKESIQFYWTICKKTPEKVEILENALKKLKI